MTTAISNNCTFCKTIPLELIYVRIGLYQGNFCLGCLAQVADMYFQQTRLNHQDNEQLIEVMNKYTQLTKDQKLKIKHLKQKNKSLKIKSESQGFILKNIFNKKETYGI